MNKLERTLESTVVSLPSRELLKKYLEPKPLELCPEMTVLQTTQVFDFWEEWEKESGSQKDTPFWAVVWPAAALLARYIFDNPAYVRQKRVLDLGCGSGIPAVASALAGALSVQANDIDPLALEIASLNALLNGVSIQFSCGNLVEAGKIPEADVILVADLFYNRTQSAQLLEFLHHARSLGTEVLIADGNRPFAPRTGIELLKSASVKVNMELEGLPERDVRVLELL